MGTGRTTGWNPNTLGEAGKGAPTPNRSTRGTERDRKELPLTEPKMLPRGPRRTPWATVGGPGPTQRGLTAGGWAWVDEGFFLSSPPGPGLTVPSGPQGSLPLSRSLNLEFSECRQIHHRLLRWPSVPTHPLASGAPQTQRAAALQTKEPEH